MKKRFLSVFLALTLCLTLLPTAALAFQPKAYGIFVCGTAVAENNEGNVLVDTANNGKVSYNPTSKTLTLNGATLTGGGSGTDSVICDGTGSLLTIKLVGENTITVSGNDVFRGIYAKQDLTITGTGSLTIEFAADATSVQQTYGIYVDSGALTVESGATVTVHGGNAESESGSAESYGVWANGAVTVGTNGILNADAGTAASTTYIARSYGVFARSVTVNGTATVNAGEAKSGSNKAESYGVWAESTSGGNVTVNASGTLNVNTAAGAGKATSEGSSADSYGVYAKKGNMTVNGTANVTAGDAKANNDVRSYGVRAETVSLDGTATVNAGAAESTSMARSYGVYAESGVMTVNATGNLTANANTATGTGDRVESVGVYVTTPDTSDDRPSTVATIRGTVNASGGRASGSSYGFLLDEAGNNATLTVEGTAGSLTGTGGASATSYGIYVCNNSGSSYTTTVTLSGGTMLGQTTAALDGGSSGTATATNNIGIYVDTESTNADVDIQSGTATGYGTDCGVYVKGALKVGVDTEASVTLHAKASENGKAVYAYSTVEGAAPLQRGTGVNVVTPKGGDVYTNTAADSSTYATVLTGSDSTSEVATEALLQRIYVEPEEPVVPDVPEEDDSEPTYSIIVEPTTHGTIPLKRKYGHEGDIVTIEVEPDKGYTLETLTVLDKNGKEIELTAKGDGKYTFKMPGGKVEVKATFAEDNSMLNFFVDVTADKYYYDAVLWAAENGITGGIDENHFGPDQFCTRAQLVTFLYRYVQSQGGGFTGAWMFRLPFSDVPEWCYEAVAWCYMNNVAGGYGNGLFGTNDTITREQFVTILYRFTVAMGMDTTQGGMAVREFADYESISDYAIEAMQWAVNAGILQGNDGRLMPRNNCTRAQIVTMLYRLLGE